MTHADTHHINACRNAWYRHFKDCGQCYYTQTAAVKCLTGQVLWDEYRHAISANPDLEELEAKEAP